jgi:predicted P-loop ATPase/phage/plasmid primase-like uncharacterized protein
MADLLQQFIDELSSKGCPPQNSSDIIADNKWRRFKVVGDKKPDCSYQLKIDGDFAIARFIYFKHGESHSWHSASKSDWTPAEKKAFMERLEKEKAIHAKAQQAEFSQVAQEARELWRAGVEKSHPYLEKKKIDIKGARVVDMKNDEGKLQKDILIIPIYKDDKISSLQRIWPNGFKAFLRGGDVKGGYTAFTDQEDDRSRLIICEGWATGKAIRMAVEKYPVIVAFNSGNLADVAQLMRTKYPSADIIIAADNDQWTLKAQKRPADIDDKIILGDDELWTKWRKEHRCYNPGIKAARAAAVKIGAHVIYPDIPADNKDKLTDFDDLKELKGLEAVRERIIAAAPASVAQDRAAGVTPFDTSQPVSQDEMLEYYSTVPLHDEMANAAAQVDLYTDEREKYIDATKDPHHNWQELIETTDKGLTKPKFLDNIRVFLKHDPDYRGLFVYDEFSHEKVLARCPPWEDEKKFKPRSVRDTDFTRLTMHLEHKGMFAGFSNTKKVVEAQIMENSRNPAREYFKSLVWDGIPRLDTWLRTYAGCVEDDQEYVGVVGRKWLTAAVARVMQPGCKFDHMLILEGKQDIGKSFLLEELATIHGKRYFDDTIKAKEISSAKVIPKLQGILIVELSEMTGFNKMGSDEAKQVISSKVDRIVRKYENEPTLMPRQFVFAGTINNIAGYLTDPTGNRRYWPVKCTKIDLKSLKRDKEQLWAEAVDCFLNNEQLWLDDPRIKEKAQQVQLSRKEAHPWEVDLNDLTAGKDHVYPKEIWDALFITDRSRRTTETQSIVTGIMTGFGFHLRRKRYGGKMQQVWERIEKNEPDLLDAVNKGGMEIDW